MSKEDLQSLQVLFLKLWKRKIHKEKKKFPERV